MVLVDLLTILAVVQVGSLFSADAWNNVTFTAGEVKNPSRNLPLSLALGTGVVHHALHRLQFCLSDVLPLHGDPAWRDDAGARHSICHGRSRGHGGDDADVRLRPAAWLMAAAILVSTFRLRQRPDPRRGARLLRHGQGWPVLSQRGASCIRRYKTPVAFRCMVQLVWTCVLCVSGSYGQLLDYIIFAVLVFYILTIVGLFVLRRKHPDAERPYRAIGYPVLPAMYIVMALFIDVVLLRYKPQYTWPGLVIVLLGVPVYFLWSRRARSTYGISLD